MSFTDEQLLNLVNSTITKKTEFQPDDFTGGSVQTTSTNNNRITNFKVSLFFGYKSKKPITRTIEISKDTYYIWAKAILAKTLALENNNIGMDFSELNDLMNNPPIVDSNEVVSSKYISKVEVPLQVEGVVEKPKKETYSNEIKEIINHLNDVLNTNYRTNTDSTRTLIKARLNNGFTVDDFKQVHIIKFSEWTGTDMQKFLRPETLYGNKFESYLNQKISDYEKMKAVNSHTGMSALEMLKQQGYA